MKKALIGIAAYIGAGIALTEWQDCWVSTKIVKETMEPVLSEEGKAFGDKSKLYGITAAAYNAFTVLRMPILQIKTEIDGLRNSKNDNVTEG